MYFSKLLLSAIVMLSVSGCGIGWIGGGLSGPKVFINHSGLATQPYRIDLEYGGFTKTTMYASDMLIDNKPVYGLFFSGKIEVQGLLTLTPLDSSYQPIAGVKIYKLLGETGNSVSAVLNVSRDANGAFEVKCDGECQRIVLQP